MTRYLDDIDRRNLHLLVHAERLDDLADYVKSLRKTIEARRKLDPNRTTARPFGGLRFERVEPLPEGSEVLVVPSVTITAVREAFDKACEVSDIDLDTGYDPYEASDEVRAFYELSVALKRLFAGRYSGKADIVEIPAGIVVKP